MFTYVVEHECALTLVVILRPFGPLGQRAHCYQGRVSPSEDVVSLACSLLFHNPWSFRCSCVMMLHIARCTNVSCQKKSFITPICISLVSTWKRPVTPSYPGVALITCQGRDHVVPIQSWRHRLGDCQRPFRIGASLDTITCRLHPIHMHWHSYPNVVSIILGDFNICDPMAIRDILMCSILSFHTSFRLPNLIGGEETPQPLVSYALFQGLIVLYQRTYG